MNAESIARVMIVGEVLWDCFPDHRVLGGAPFNVAWNLAGFGAAPLMVSAVGEDDLGREILQRMRDWNLATDKIAVLPDRPTGTVQVTLDQGEPSYEITADVAWDSIPEPHFDASQVGYLYCGSLAWRSDATRSTIFNLRKKISAPVFIDVNIRLPHFDLAWMEPMLRDADCVKLNVDELSRITAKSIDSKPQRHAVARDLLNRFGIRQLYVTLGAAGAEWFSRGGELISVAAPKPKKWADAVGAGDAFASVVLHGQVHQRDPEQTLHDAVDFAADVCGLSGATTQDGKFYERSFLA